MRGQGYYTGMVFEVTCPQFSGAVAGGGRYDNMVGKFIGQQVPAVGFSIGFERVCGILLEQGYQIPGAKPKMALLYLKDADFAAVLAKAESLRADYDVTVLPQAKKPGRSAANSEAIRHPKLHAWLLMAWAISSNIASFTSYTPPGMGFNSPPLPTMASNSKGISLAFSSSITRFLRNSNWSIIRGNPDNSSTEWRILRTKRGVSSLYTAILVDVEPGLTASTFIIYDLTIYD